MPQSLSFLLIHIIFSTKDRAPVLNENIAGPLHAYLATVARNLDCPCYRVGGVADHVHLAIRLSRTHTVADLIANLKGSSSKWLKVQFPQLANFAWQRGYAAFSVGPADLASLERYIEEQALHHQSKSFQDELRALFAKYGLEFDERYAWD